MAKVPDNLILLHTGEETLRQRALHLVEAHADLPDHLDIAERAMDMMDMLRQHYQATDDERAISHLAIRVFNDFATSGIIAPLTQAPLRHEAGHLRLAELRRQDEAHPSRGVPRRDGEGGAIIGVHVHSGVVHTVTGVSAANVTTLFALANLWMKRRTLLAIAG